MTPQDFERAAADVAAWISAYHDRVGSLPVLSRVAPGEVRAGLPSEPPMQGERFEAVMRDLDRVILPGITHWQSPGFFGFFPANTSFPSVLADMISTGLGVQGMLWATSPACTELETHMLDWVADMLGLPDGFKSTGRGGGVIQDTASSATLCALIAGRHRITAGAASREGSRAPLVAYASEQAHSSVEKAVRIAGVGSDNLRLIETDDRLAMNPDALADAIRRDRAAGSAPFFVCATIGTTSSNAIDPLPAIADVCRREGNDDDDRGIWLHVDAAMSGTAALCPEFRWIHDGLEHADSYCFNPHKWMLTVFDCDCFYVRDRAALIDSLSVTPEYLRNRATESGTVFDYRDWHVPLGRRFRALKLWFVIRHYGVEGLQAHVRSGVKMAQWLREQVEAHDDFELAAPAPLNLVCFRHRGDDAFNQRLHEAINAEGSIYLTHTRLHGRYTVRMAIGGAATRFEHVRKAWGLIVEAASRLT